MQKTKGTNSSVQILPNLVQHINLLLSYVGPFLPRMKLSIIIQLSIAPLSQCELLIIYESRRHLTPTIFEVGFELFKHVHPVVFTGFPVKSQPVEGEGDTNYCGSWNEFLSTCTKLIQPHLQIIAIYLLSAIILYGSRQSGWPALRRASSRTWPTHVLNDCKVLFSGNFILPMDLFCFEFRMTSE